MQDFLNINALKPPKNDIFTNTCHLSNKEKRQTAEVTFHM